MFNESHTDSIDVLDHISIQLNRYFSTFIFLFGTIGNLLNCAVLSRPSLRSSPCAFLFLISSIASIISITSGLTTRILSGWDMDFASTNRFLCKGRAFIMFVSRTVAFWLIAYATVDRWYSSCFEYHRRKLSSLKNAQRGTILIIIFSILLYGPVIYCYEPNLIFAPLQCYAKTIPCRLFTDLTYALITILCPLLMMPIFGFLTISNLRQRYSARSSKGISVDLNETTIIRSSNIRRRRWKKNRSIFTSRAFHPNYLSHHSHHATSDRKTLHNIDNPYE